jgi:hypothetical protein
MERQTGWMPWPLDGVAMSDVLRWERGEIPCPAPWTVRVTWRIADGTATPFGVELRGAHGQTVTAEGWRSIRVREVIDQSRAVVRTWAEVGRVLAAHGSEPDAQAAAEHASTAAAMEPPRKRGAQPKYKPEHYRRVAEIYLRAVGTEDPHPVRAVAAAFADTYPGVTDPLDYRPKAWVRTARTLGLLTQQENK